LVDPGKKVEDIRVNPGYPRVGTAYAPCDQSHDAPLIVGPRAHQRRASVALRKKFNLQCNRMKNTKRNALKAHRARIFAGFSTGAQKAVAIEDKGGPEPGLPEQVLADPRVHDGYINFPHDALVRASRPEEVLPPARDVAPGADDRADGGSTG